MIRLFLVAILFLGSNLFWNLDLYSQQIKITYEASAKDVSHSNKKTRLTLSQLADNINKSLPSIDFIALSDNQLYRFYYERGMINDFDGMDWTKVALSVAMDGKKILGDYSNNIAYYEPSITTKIRSVRMDNLLWDISQEFKYILGYKCYKATGKIANPEDEYKLTPPKIAWFCPQLNARGGPTAYATLPGMILELENDKIKFVAKKVEQKTNTKLKIPDYNPGNILNHKEWNAYFSANNPIPALRREN